MVILQKLLFPPARINKKRIYSRLAGRTVLITGASSGIGEALAYLLAPYPIRLVLVARRQERLDFIKKEIESIRSNTAEVICYSVDLRDNQEEWHRSLLELPEGIDIIISNAGHSIRRSVFESLERHHDITRTAAINYLAPTKLILALLPMLEHKRGQIIHTSTINMKLPPFPYWSAYLGSKAAFDHWFQSVSPELRARGIAASTIYLPLVRTPMIEPTDFYRHIPAMSAEHAAVKIVNLMCSRKKNWLPWWIRLSSLLPVFVGELARKVWEYRIVKQMSSQNKYLAKRNRRGSL